MTTVEVYDWKINSEMAVNLHKLLTDRKELLADDLSSLVLNDPDNASQIATATEYVFISDMLRDLNRIVMKFGNDNG